MTVTVQEKLSMLHVSDQIFAKVHISLANSRYNFVQGVYFNRSIKLDSHILN